MVELNEKLAAAWEGDWPQGEVWGLGDQAPIAVLLEETEKADNDLIPAPRINDDQTYVFDAVERLHGMALGERKAVAVGVDLVFERDVHHVEIERDEHVQDGHVSADAAATSSPSVMARFTSAVSSGSGMGES